MKHITKLNINGDTVYIKNSILGYTVVYPIKDPETNKINWFNFIIGGWDNLFLILFITFMTLSFYYVYWNDTHEMQKVVIDPCSYCGTDNMKKVLTIRTQEQASNEALFAKYNFSKYMNKGGEQE